MTPRVTLERTSRRRLHLDGDPDRAALPYEMAQPEPHSWR